LITSTMILSVVYIYIYIYFFAFVHSLPIRNEVIEVRKIVNSTNVVTNDFEVQIHLRAIEENLSDIKIADSLPEMTILKSGKLNESLEKLTDTWFIYSYQVKVILNPSLFSIFNRNVQIKFPSAEISYLRRNRRNSTEIIFTESPSIFIRLEDHLIPKGGWLLEEIFNSKLNYYSSMIIVGFFTIPFPVLSAFFLINYYHHKRLGRQRKEKRF